MATKPRFNEAAFTPEYKAILGQESIVEARDKISRLQKFYTKQEQAKGWVFPNKTFNYLRQYKREGEKRKDKVKESILHEVDQCLWVSSLYKAGILPEEVTHQIIDGQELAIEEAEQSIEHVFNTMHTHDLLEDFILANTSEMIYVLREKTKNIHELPLPSKEKMIQFIAKSTKAITFDYKTFNPDTFDYHTFDENMKDMTITIPKYKNNDRQLYTNDLEKIWAAIATKAVDRLGGCITRYNNIPNVFTYGQQRAYLEETAQLFHQRRTLENMQRRYPELKDYFDVVNNNLSIAYRCFGAILSNHPKNKYRSGNPNTARIDIEEFIEKAFMGREHVCLDVSPMKTMLDGYKALAARMPEFQNLVTQMDNQISPHLKHHIAPKLIPAEKNNLIIH